MSFNIDTDHSLIDKGVWATFNGGRFLIAHISNMAFQRELARLQQPYRRKIEAGNLDPETNRSILCQAMSKHVILDWSELVDGSGKSVSYDAATAQRLLEKNPELRDFVTEFAVNIQNFRSEEVAELGKP